LLRRYQYVSVKQYGQVAESVEEHLAIVAAIRSRDLDLAIKRLEEHIHF
jgi:DNA-binding GntR family transcriptional regulator